MKTKLTKTIKSLTCAVLAAAMLFTCTADVQAAKKSTYKTIKPNKSCTKGIEYVKYESTTSVELSEDGQTLICTDIDRDKKTGFIKKTVNLKKFIPADILEKFEDGEVYMYTYTSIEEQIKSGHYYYESLCDKSSVAAYTKYLKSLYSDAKKVTIKKKHFTDNEDFDPVASKHNSKKCDKIFMEDGRDSYYIYSVKALYSSTDGSGKFSEALISDGGSFILADKNGKKIINIEFTHADLDEIFGLGVSHNLDDMVDESPDTIIMTSGETLSTKIAWTGRALEGDTQDTTVYYDSSLLTIKKDGTVTAKKGKYGIAVLYIGRSAYFSDYYYIFVTDGSSKMLKSLKKKAAFSDGGYHHATLTIGKNGKYTIKLTN